eukprot:6157529-Amphidinium_carterae.1
MVFLWDACLEEGFGCSSASGVGKLCPVSCGLCEDLGYEAPLCDEDEVSHEPPCVHQHPETELRRVSNLAL